MNWYVQPVSKTKRSKLKESPVMGPRTRVEPANGFPSTANRWRGRSYISGPGDVDRVERRQPTALANTVTMLKRRPSRWKDYTRPVGRRITRNSSVRKGILVDCRSTSEDGRGPSYDPRLSSSASRIYTGGVHGLHAMAQTWPHAFASIGRMGLMPSLGLRTNYL